MDKFLLANNKQMKIKNLKSGFTLVELLIAISLFIVVFTISLGALLSIFDANKRAQSSKTVVDNLNLSIENMARTARFGSNYYCGVSSITTATNNCPPGGNALSVTFAGNRIVYKWDGLGTPLQRSDQGGFTGTYTDITSPETKITYLKFYVFGSSKSDTNQPYIKVIIQGYVGDKPTTQSSFSIETLMSQRTLDI